MFEMQEIAERLRNQHNRITAEPIFLVQEQERIYGIAIEFDPAIEWLHGDENIAVPEEEAAKLEADYQRNYKEPEDYRRVGFVDRWIYVQPFFTEAAAELYIKQNSHRHRGKLRTYAESAYRNHEWIAIRAYLMSLGESEAVEGGKETSAA